MVNELNELQSHYRSVRKRLWEPPNAKADDEIDLKRRPHEVPVIKYRRPRPRLPSFPPLPPSALEPKWDRRPTVHEIVKAVAGVFLVSMTDIRSARRQWHIVRPRQIVYALARRLTLYSLTDIGRHLGGRDHTSVLQGCNKPFIVAAIAAVETEMGDSLDPVAWAQAIRRAMP